MKKLMLSVAALMMSVSVSTFVSYAQGPTEEPASTDTVPTQEPKKDEPKESALLLCLSEEPASTDTVPTQEPKKDEPKEGTLLLCLTEEPASTDTVPTQEPKKDEPKVNNFMA